MSMSHTGMNVNILRRMFKKKKQCTVSDVETTMERMMGYRENTFASKVSINN